MTQYVDIARQLKRPCLSAYRVLSYYYVHAPSSCRMHGPAFLYPSCCALMKAGLFRIRICASIKADLPLSSWGAWVGARGPLLGSAAWNVLCKPRAPVLGPVCNWGMGHHMHRRNRAVLGPLLCAHAAWDVAIYSAETGRLWVLFWACGLRCAGRARSPPFGQLEQAFGQLAFRYEDEFHQQG